MKPYRTLNEVKSEVNEPKYVRDTSGPYVPAKPSGHNLTTKLSIEERKRIQATNYGKFSDLSVRDSVACLICANLIGASKNHEYTEMTEIVDKASRYADEIIDKLKLCLR